MAKVEICPTTACWLWKGATDRYGYGKLKITGERQPEKAHKLSFRLHIGEVPTYTSSHTGHQLDKLLCHSCDNRSCINPNHLTPGTTHQNAFDRDNPSHPDRTQPHDMSASMNEVRLVGNLTRDPELRYTPKGTPVAEIAIATNRRFLNSQTEQWEEVTTFIDVTIWGRDAEQTSQFCKKGRGVLIQGRLEVDTWEDKDTGKKRSKLKVVSEKIQFLASAEVAASSARARETRTQREQREAAESAGHHGRSPDQNGAAPPTVSDSTDDDFDDVPF